MYIYLRVTQALNKRTVIHVLTVFHRTERPTTSGTNNGPLITALENTRTHEGLV